MTYPIDLSAAQSLTEPFCHFDVAQALDESLAAEALSWFENGAPWELTVAAFYEQHEFRLLDADAPRAVRILGEPETLDRLRRDVGSLLRADLADSVDITVHRLMSGQRIRIHNDYIPGKETHRLLVQLNRGWTEDQGGILMLFGSPRPEDVRRLVPPVHRSSLGFAISPNSHHAVSTVYSGERFTLVYSFYAR